MKNFISAFIFIVTVISCGTGYLVNLDEPTDFPEGRNLYVSKCSGCHKYYYPTDFTIVKWDSILVSMKEKAKISVEERNSILGWISEKVSSDSLGSKNH